MKPSSGLLLFALVIIVAIALLNLVQNLQALSLGGMIEVPRILVFPVGLGLETAVIGTYVLSLAALGVFLLALFWTRPKAGRFPYEELLPIVIAILTLLAVVLLIQPFVGDSVGQGVEEGSEGGVVEETILGGGVVIEEDPATPVELLEQAIPVAAPRLFGLILAFLAIVAIYFLLMTFRARRSLSWAAIVEEGDAKSEMTEALEERIYSLRLGGDVRLAILGCYRDLVELLRTRGVATASHLTAREVESLALDSLGISTESSEALRKLFEEARYSFHPMTQAHRRAALVSLERVRNELGA